MTEGTNHFDNCPRCAQSVLPDDRFCAKCGHDLSQKTCPTCDANNDVGANFCAACGASLIVAAPPIVALAPAAPEPPAPQIETAGESEVVAGPPDGWEPPPSEDLEIPGVRTALSESAAGDPLPFEPRRVPAGGMAAWSRADATTQPNQTLTGGTDLIVIERSGAWAHVLGENGWKGWVDDRLLIDPDLAG